MSKPDTTEFSLTERRAAEAEIRNPRFILTGTKGSACLYIQNAQNREGRRTKLHYIAKYIAGDVPSNIC